LFWKRKSQSVSPPAAKDASQQAPKVTISRAPASTTTGNTSVEVTVVQSGKRPRKRVHDYMVTGSR
jgi:hypothetical protein